MELKIVYSDNEYYVEGYGTFYGPYHSMADAEIHSKNLKNTDKASISNYRFIKNVYYRC